MPALATLEIPEAWRSLEPAQTAQSGAAQRAIDLLERELLPAYLPTQRWYAAKETGIRGITLGDRQEWAEWWLTLVRVDLVDGSAQEYFLPLSIQWEESVDDVMAGAVPAAALARVRRQSVAGLLYDASADEAFVRAVAQAMKVPSEVPLAAGWLVFSPTDADSDGVVDPSLGRVSFPAEGSNSSAILDDQLFLKIYRRLRPGIHHEVEMGRFLTEVSPFSQIVPLLGALEYRNPDREPTTLAVLQGYAPNQGDLWEVTLSLLDCLCDEHGDQTEAWSTDPAQLSYAALVDTLGRRVAELHLALTKPGGGVPFDPEPITEADLAVLREDIRQEALLTVERLDRHAASVPGIARTRAEGLRRRRDSLIARIDDLTPATLDAVKTRCHGDLHLGQVLVTKNDLVLIDFEGEPARPLAERRAKQCPLVDVAGIVRSFHYAAGSLLVRMSQDRSSERERLAEPISCWRAAMIQRFLSAYEQAAAGSPSLPGSAQQVNDLIELFTLQKALYEIRYELDNRPAWVSIPVDGVLASLGSRR